MRNLAATFALFALVYAAAAPSKAAAQEAIDPAWAQQFIGSWAVQLATPDGQVPVRVNVRENAGQLVVVLGNASGEGDPITNVRRIGDSLLADYEMDYQGMTIDAQLRLERQGEELATNWSFAGGAYETRAMGTRQ